MRPLSYYYYIFQIHDMAHEHVHAEGVVHDMAHANFRARQTLGEVYFLLQKNKKALRLLVYVMLLAHEALSY